MKYRSIYLAVRWLRRCPNYNGEIRLHKIYKKNMDSIQLKHLVESYAKDLAW